ncbi:MAG: alpha/beta fold hydrolase [Caulobacteraceae bacterium]
MTPDAEPPAPRGRMVEIAPGRRLHLIRAGPTDGSGPLVVLEAGAFGFSADWAAVQGKLAAEGVASFAYDRAGLGFSDPGPSPRDSLAIAGDLEALLAGAGEAGPLILCAHSMAGLHARLFASRNPERMRGLVLVDATTPEAMESKWVGGLVGQFARASRLAAWGAEAGLLRPLAESLGDAIGLHGAARAEKRWAFALGSHNRQAAEEVASWAASARMAREAAGLDPDWPVAVILAGKPGGASKLRAMQAAPARGSRAGRIETVAGASHATLLGGGYADAIVRGVAHVIES